MDGGFRMNLRVSPGSSYSGVRGYNQWRNEWDIHIRSPPEKGKANSELVEVLSEIFSIPSSRIEIISGHRDHKKTVEVLCLSLQTGLRCLKEVVHES